MDFLMNIVSSPEGSLKMKTVLSKILAELQKPDDKEVCLLRTDKRHITRLWESNPYLIHESPEQ